MEDKKYVTLFRTFDACPLSFNERFLYSLCYRRAQAPAEIGGATGWHHHTIAKVKDELAGHGLVEFHGGAVRSRPITPQLAGWFRGEQNFVPVFLPVPDKLKLNRAAVYSLCLCEAKGERTTKALCRKYFALALSLDPQTVEAALGDLESLALIRRFPANDHRSFVVGIGQGQPDLFQDQEPVTYDGLAEWLETPSGQPKPPPPRPAAAPWPETLRIMLDDGCAVHYCRPILKWAVAHAVPELAFRDYMAYAKQVRLQDVAAGKTNTKDYTALLRHLLKTYNHADIVKMLERVREKERKKEYALRMEALRERRAREEDERRRREEEEWQARKLECERRQLAKYADALTAPLDDQYFALRFNDPEPEGYRGYYYERFQRAPSWAGRDAILREIAGFYPCLPSAEYRKRAKWHEYTRRVADRILDETRREKGPPPL